ncbi:Uncharacterized protein BM_BM399 [Brugia malayi]|uniref:Bm399, isoform b n=2 Tax=Brugia TaxID=6278 RepID=A0A1P6BZQ8_BRUMA|nr:Uncharacterized protein BM_BM399 [Brugia malayi]CDP94456.1 Bm399, isoform b [Brugia malayi]VIO88965.1 Uncharacterized protein BM_BM399 [Brugia malayi]
MFFNLNSTNVDAKNYSAEFSVELNSPNSIFKSISEVIFVYWCVFLLQLLQVPAYLVIIVRYHCILLSHLSAGSTRILPSYFLYN